MNLRPLDPQALAAGRLPDLDGLVVLVDVRGSPGRSASYRGSCHSVRHSPAPGKSKNCHPGQPLLVAAPLHSFGRLVDLTSPTAQRPPHARRRRRTSPGLPSAIPSTWQRPTTRMPVGSPRRNRARPLSSSAHGHPRGSPRGGRRDGTPPSRRSARPARACPLLIWLTRQAW